MPQIVRFHQFGGPDVLKIEDAKPSEPARDEARIRVRAIGLNRADILMRSGSYIETPTLPSGLGLEAAGTVDAVGANVEGLSPGDVVSVIPPISMERWPAYGELAIFPANHIVRHPPALDFKTAAAIWMPYLTAYGALVDIAKIASGERVLIPAASSSVGLAAIQIANHLGAVPIAVTRGRNKQQALLDAGAHDVVISGEDDFTSRLLATGGTDGFRVVFDPVAGPAFTAIVAAMAERGILIEYGGLSAMPTPFPVGPVLAKSLTLRGYLVHEIVRDAARLEKAKAFILAGLESGALEPVIAKVFPFEQIAQAHTFIEQGEHMGKVVVTI